MVSPAEGENIGGASFSKPAIKKIQTEKVGFLLISSRNIGDTVAPPATPVPWTKYWFNFLKLSLDKDYRNYWIKSRPLIQVDL